MRQFVYFLILLLISAQFDDIWAASAVVASAPLSQVNEDDEYLPSQRRTQGEESSERQTPVFHAQKPQTAGYSVARNGVPSESNLIAPFAPPPLYIFMSLQI